MYQKAMTGSFPFWGKIICWKRPYYPLLTWEQSSHRSPLHTHQHSWITKWSGVTVDVISAKIRSNTKIILCLGKNMVFYTQHGLIMAISWQSWHVAGIYWESPTVSRLPKFCEKFSILSSKSSYKISTYAYRITTVIHCSRVASWLIISRRIGDCWEKFMKQPWSMRRTTDGSLKFVKDFLHCRFKNSIWFFEHLCTVFQ